MTLKVLVYAAIAALAAVAAPARAQAPAYQGKLPANVVGPRKVAVTAEGDVYVADARGALHRLTRRGDYVAQVLDGVTAVATAPGAVLAATEDGALVQLHPRTGRVLRTTALDTSEAPVALAFDAASQQVWTALASGAIVGRALDGKKVREIAPRRGVHRLKGLAVAAGKLWALQDRTGEGGALLAFDAATGKYLASTPVPVRIAGDLAIGADGRFYVSSFVDGQVKLLDARGAATAAVGKYGSAPGELNQPAGVAFLANGDLLVANMDGGRLDRFGSGAPLPDCGGDADCDGLPDEWETANGLDPNDARNALRDTDGDGLNDAEELAYGGNPRSADTDGDGHPDALEVREGFQVANRDDHRPALALSGGETDPGLVELGVTLTDPVRRDGCSVRVTQVGGPRVALRGERSLSPSFIARAAGTYRFEGEASCGRDSSARAAAEVVVRNVAPLADAGRVLTVRPGEDVRLSAARSSDANGDRLAIRWEQASGEAVLAPAATAAISARAAGEGYYAFRATAADPAGAKRAADVPVVVVRDDDMPGDRVPTAVVASPVLARAGEAVVLDASGSFRGAAATFAWRQTAGAPVLLSGAATPAARFVATASGRYAFEVAVANGALTSPPARVEVFVAPGGGALPVAQVAPLEPVAVNVPATLDGTASAAGSGAALTYAWRQVSGPAAGLTRADRATATVVPFEPGSYEFELVVADEAAVSVPARVRLEARAGGRPIPVARAAAEANAMIGQLVLLDGRASTPAAGHRWTQVAGPWTAVTQGSVATFRPVVPGEYAFELEVEEGAVRSAPARVSVVVDSNGTEN